MSAIELLTKPGKAIKAEKKDFEELASFLSCKLSMVAAVWQVEAPKGPFFENGMCTALGERATFYNFLPIEMRKEAVAKGIAVPQWSRRYQKQLYGDQGTPEGVWNCIREMVEFHPPAGWKSFSLGGPQTMTFNARHCGLKSPQDMLRQYRDSERAQMLGFLRYVQKAGLVDEMQRMDFAGFALGYNGSGQVKYYANALRRAQGKWARILKE